ncbi:MAG: hypothetical protein WD971_00680 [Pirellulales bacterium]
MSSVPTNSGIHLRVSAYDRVSSWLVSLLVMTSVVVGSLLMIYFARQLATIEVAVPVRPVTLPNGGGGGGDSRGGTGGDADLLEFTAAEESSEPQLQNTLDTIAGAVAQTKPLLFNDQIDADAAPSVAQDYIDTRRPGTTGAGGGRGTGFGTGTGSGRGPGSGEGTGGGIGRREPEREIRFEPENLLEYAQYLDFFKIELGVLGQDNKIYYAYNLSERMPSVREGTPADEQRLYMNSARGRFAALDRRLAQRANIVNRGQIILQFYPEETQAILYGLERARAQSADREPEEIFRTVYRVTHTGNRFEFTIDEQQYK